jgi:hypothetical protein
MVLPKQEWTSTPLKTQQGKWLLACTLDINFSGSDPLTFARNPFCIFRVEVVLRAKLRRVALVIAQEHHAREQIDLSSSSPATAASRGC